LRNSNKQYLIVTKFCVHNASFIDAQYAKFRLNVLKQTTVTMVFVRLPQNTSVSGLCVWRHPQTWNWSVFGVN